MNADAVVECRKQQAWRDLHQPREIVQSSANTLKIALFCQAVESVLAYSLEVVLITSTRETAMNASYRRLLLSSV